MTKCYFEVRKKSARGTDSFIADIMRHLHTRQHLGKAMVVCEVNRELDLLGPSRKQWLKLARMLQKQRATTLNADKILKYTHTITRMQHMRFSYKDPLHDPEAEVYFLTPDTMQTVPIHCYSVYVTVPLTIAQASSVVGQVPPEALFVDYDHRAAWQEAGLQPKSRLEQEVTVQWRQVQQFLHTNAIDVQLLTPRDGLHDIDALDDALDTLLNRSHSFLRVATDFQRSLELARPLRIPREQREAYDLVILLAHRVQALSPGPFTQHFLESYNEDDTFFLYDAAQYRQQLASEPLEQAVARHVAAGRPALARAIQYMCS